MIKEYDVAGCLCKKQFPGVSSPGVNTVGDTFSSVPNQEAPSQFNGSAICLNGDWGSGFWTGLFSPYAISGGSATSYGLGTLTHELLHKKSVGGGFSHLDMNAALDAVGARGVRLAVMIFPIVSLGFAFQGVLNETERLGLGGSCCWGRSRFFLAIRNRCRDKLRAVAAKSRQMVCARNVSLHTTRRLEQSGKHLRSGAERVDLRIGVLVHSSFPSSIKT
jgi:hypothetical protein